MRMIEEFEEGYRACAWVLESFEAEVEGLTPAEEEEGIEQFRAEVSGCVAKHYAAWDKFCKVRGER